jgi:membrane protease YdiL (CAAX protease family)
VTEAALPARGNGRLVAWLSLVAVLTALNYLGRYGTSTEPDRDILYEWSSFVGGVIQFGLMLGIVLWIAAGGPARELLALRAPRSWPAALGLAALIFVGVLVVAAALSPFLDAGDEQGLLPERWDPSRAAPFFANATLIAGLTPVVEELMFRGLGFSLLSRFGSPTAIVVVGVLFGPVHGLVLGLPILIGFGLGLAYLRHRSGSVLPCMLLHAVFNGMALLAAVTLGGDG